MTSRTEPLIFLTPTGTRAGTRAIAIETPVAIEVNGIGYAVMMATPAALDAFVTGFLLTERLIDRPGDVLDIDHHQTTDGFIVRATVVPSVAKRIHDRVRHRTSDTACGLCGVSGLEQVVRPVERPALTSHITPPALFAAIQSIRDHQPLNRRTGAHHAAAFFDRDGAVGQAFEDVGRHNALDKLIGALAIAAIDPADGFILVTSRISFEMVDKALVAGASLLVGISAPTSMAIDHARTHGLTLIALARADAMLVLNDPHEIFSRVVAKEGLEPPTPGL